MVLPSVIKLEGVLASIKNNERKDGAAEGNEKRLPVSEPKSVSPKPVWTYATIKLQRGPMQLSEPKRLLKMPPRNGLPGRSMMSLAPHGNDLPPKKLLP